MMSMGRLFVIMTSIGRLFVIMTSIGHLFITMPVAPLCPTHQRSAQGARPFPAAAPTGQPGNDANVRHGQSFWRGEAVFSRDSLQDFLVGMT